MHAISIHVLNISHRKYQFNNLGGAINIELLFVFSWHIPCVVEDKPRNCAFHALPRHQNVEEIPLRSVGKSKLPSG